MDKLYGRLVSVGSLSGTLSGENTISGELAPFKPSGNYHGETVVTPSSETQVLETAGKTLKDDITINPIPSNYGLITWNGSTLTVS